MRSPAILAAVIMACYAPSLAAQEIAYDTVISHTEEVQRAKTRFVPTAVAAAEKQGVAFGPFRVLNEVRAAIVDVTDVHSPAAFERMLRAYPRIAILEMWECPGTENDLANLKLGRMIRSRGIATYVPEGGSVRSGAVELFLAGVRRYADKGAEFAVHAWMDDRGREAGDYAATAPENRKYVDYYRQMGMSESEANAFYTMTNSVPHAEALWFDGAGMADWVRLDSFEG